MLTVLPTPGFAPVLGSPDAPALGLAPVLGAAVGAAEPPVRAQPAKTSMRMVAPTISRPNLMWFIE